MPCCGDREKLGALRAEQKWDYINLDEFKSESCFTPFSYGVLYISLIISISVYSVDTFTAIQLLAFDRWSSQIKPAVPFNISRWIFAGCIILSFVLLFYRWLRAIRVMRKGGVAQSYLDPLAVRLQSIRVGSHGRGWKRFLVFAELTKGKKGADYVALFSYFSFEAWLRVVFGDGPRQVLNAITLYSVMKVKLIPTGSHAATDGRSSVQQFFFNVETLAGSNRLQAAILFGMLFTLFIWVITIINLAIAVVLYIFFLWHHIPSSDGGLSSYCRRQINRRMDKIVQAKVAKTLKKENALRERQEGKDVKRQPTLPTIGADSDEKLPEMPLISRTTTQSTLPPYDSERADSLKSITSDLGIQRQPTTPLDTTARPFGPMRTDTEASTASNASYASNAPLMGGAGSIGYGGRSASPGPSPVGYGGRLGTPVSQSPTNYDGRPIPPGRSLTGSTLVSQRSYPGPPQPPTAQGRQTPVGYPKGPGMNGSVTSFQQQPPNSYQMNTIPRPGTAGSMGPPPSVGRRTPGPPPMDGRSTPMMQNNPYIPQRSGSPALSGRRPPNSGPPGPGFMPFNTPMRSNSPQLAPQGMPRGPSRSVTQPNISAGPPTYFSAPSRAGYPPRSPTVPPPQNRQNQGGYDDILNAY